MSKGLISVRRSWFWIVILYCLSHIGFIPFLEFISADGIMNMTPPVWGWFILWGVVKIVLVGGFSWLAIYWAKSNVCLTLLIIYLFLDFIWRLVIAFASQSVHFKETYNGLHVLYVSQPMNAEKVLGLIFYIAVWLLTIVFSFCIYKVNRQLKAEKRKK